MNQKNPFLLSLAFLLLAIPTTAFAQDSETETTVESINEVSESVSDNAQASSLNSEDKLYWAKMRDVYTFQRKEFQKDKRFAISIFFGVIASDSFDATLPIGAKFHYYILENMGLELAVSYDIPLPKNRLMRAFDAYRYNALIQDKQIMHADGTFLWSPFYGKMSFLNTDLINFELNLAVGAGLVISEYKPDFNKDAENAYRAEMLLGAGAKFFIGNHVILGLDYRNYFYRKVKINNAGGGLMSVSEGTLSVGWMF